MAPTLLYSVVVFLLLFIYLCVGGITQLLLSDEPWSSPIALFGVVATFVLSLIVALIFFFGLRAIRKRFTTKPENSSYKPVRRFAAIAGVLMAASLSLGLYVPYSRVSEQKRVAEGEKESARQFLKKAGEARAAEERRIAALTPEQRDAEAKRKAEQEKAAARAAADAAAKKAADAKEQVALEAKKQADKAKRTAQLQLAAAGALTLKKAMKDPEAFSLTSLVVKPNGTACYEYRAKNGFGAIFPGSAVLSTKGRLLTNERDGNSFVAVWNKDCTAAGGDEITDLVKRLGIL